MYLATYFIGDSERALIMFPILGFAGLYGLYLHDHGALHCSLQLKSGGVNENEKAYV